MKIRGGYVSNSSSSSFIVSNSTDFKMNAEDLRNLILSKFPNYNLTIYVNEEAYFENSPIFIDNKSNGQEEIPYDAYYTFREPLACGTIVIVDVPGNEVLAERCLKSLTGFSNDVFDLCDYMSPFERSSLESLKKRAVYWIKDTSRIDRECIIKNRNIYDVLEDIYWYYTKWRDFMDPYEKHIFKRVCRNRYVDIEVFRNVISRLVRKEIEKDIDDYKKYENFLTNFKEKVEKDSEVKLLSNSVKNLKKLRDSYPDSYYKYYSNSDLDTELTALKCRKCIESGCAICGKKYASMIDEVTHSQLAVITSENALPYDVQEFLLDLAKKNGTDKMCYPHLG